ncbi:MAG TPA: DUF3169 family protein [Candidatus Eisenbergiella intestinipullorum]|nr:DUF3169 family protein [Candidatus Eisenbergiella intestinipullorum]
MSGKTDCGKKTGRPGMRRIMLRLLAWLAVGGAAGFGVSWAVCSGKGRMGKMAETMNLSFQENAWIFQTAFFLALAAVSLISFRKAAALLESGADEELDRAGEYQDTAMAANMANTILQFLLFGLAAGGSNPKMLLSVVLFLVFCCVSLVLETALVRQIQKADPMKRGDMGSLRFRKDWLESCDEAERLGIYKASWKSFEVMNSLFPVMEAVALLGKIMFGTGNFPILLTALLWAAQSGVYCFYSARYGRRGAGE